MIEKRVMIRICEMEVGISLCIGDNFLIVCGRTIIHSAQSLADSPQVGA